MYIVAVKDDKPGHYHQTEGLLLAIKERYPDARVEYIDVALRGKLYRWIVRAVLNYFPGAVTSARLSAFFRLFYTRYALPKHAPDLIVSTGGNTAAFNAALALAYRSKNILNGKLRGLKPALFTCVTTVIDLGYPRQIVLDAAPVPFTPDTLKASAAALASRYSISTRTFALLIGGDGAGYRYDRAFYEALVEMMHRLSQKEGVRWLVTTSRRTHVEIETYLQRHTASVCDLFVAYHQQPQQVVAAFLGLAEAVFVTEESSSMISEAIAAGKPVCTLGSIHQSADVNYRRILEKFVAQRRIYRVTLPGMENIDFSKLTFWVLDEPLHIRIAEQLKGCL